MYQRTPRIMLGCCWSDVQQHLCWCWPRPHHFTPSKSYFWIRPCVM